MFNLDYYEDRNIFTDSDYDDYENGKGIYSWERKKVKPQYKVYYKYCAHSDDNINREDW